MIAAVLLAVALNDRVAAIAPNDEVVAVEYDRYRSGRPRLVVATIEASDDADHEVVLVRLPDSDNGKPLVLDRKPLDERPVQLSLERLVDPKDVVVELFASHTPGADLYRVRDDKLVFIGEPSVYWGLITADLDHDGIPEIISSGCCRHTQCGVMIYIDVERFDGRRYVDDGRKYLYYRAARAGDKPAEYEFYVDEDPKNAQRPYRVRTYVEGKITRSEVLIDDEPVAANGNVSLETGDCHTIRIGAHGAAGALLHVFLEQVDAPRKPH